MKFINRNLTQDSATNKDTLSRTRNMLLLSSPHALENIKKGLDRLWAVWLISHTDEEWLMSLTKHLVFTRSERKVMAQLLDGQPKRRKELVKELVVESKVVKRATLTKALADLTKRDHIIRTQKPDEKDPTRTAVYYSIDPRFVEIVKDELEFSPDLDWPDRLGAVVESITESNTSLRDRSERLQQVFELYECDELFYIQRQMIFAAYSRLRGDKQLSNLLSNAAKRNFAKYAEHLFSAFQKNDVTAYAYLKWGLEKFNDHDRRLHSEGKFYWDDMLNDELERPSILEDSQPDGSEWVAHLEYGRIAEDFTKPIKRRESKAVQKAHDKEIRKEFVLLTQRAGYLDS